MLGWGETGGERWREREREREREKESVERVSGEIVGFLLKRLLYHTINLCRIANVLFVVIWVRIRYLVGPGQ